MRLEYSVADSSIIIILSWWFILPHYSSLPTPFLTHYPFPFPSPVQSSSGRHRHLWFPPPPPPVTTTTTLATPRPRPTTNTARPNVVVFWSCLANLFISLLLFQFGLRASLLFFVFITHSTSKNYPSIKPSISHVLTDILSFSPRLLPPANLSIPAARAIRLKFS